MSKDPQAEHFPEPSRDAQPEAEMSVPDVLPLSTEELLAQLEEFLPESTHRAGYLAVQGLRHRIRSMEAQHADEIAKKDELLTVDTRSGVGTLVAEQAMFDRYQRLFGEERVNRRVARGEMPWGVLVVQIDLIDFGEINVKFTHEAGNEAIGLVGSRLKGIVRPEDTVIRDGGDEFRLYFELQGPVDPEALVRSKMNDLQNDILRAQRTTLNYLPTISFRYAFGTWTPQSDKSLPEYKKSIDAKQQQLLPDLN